MTRDTLEAFQHYADAAGLSVGRAIGDWLGEQLPAGMHAAIGMEIAREEALDVPRSISRAVVPDEVREVSRPAGGVPAPRGVSGRPEAGSPPRPVIRGGNSPGRGTK